MDIKIPKKKGKSQTRECDREEGAEVSKGWEAGSWVHQEVETDGTEWCPGLHRGIHREDGATVH